MAYAATETEYSELYQELNQTKLNSVIEYFNAHWHSIRKEWVSGLKNESVTFNNCTNNRVESINQKLKVSCQSLAVITQDTRYSEVRERSQSLKYYTKGSCCIIFSPQ